MNVLNKLTIKHLKMNRKRTTVTIIGVILSAALMVGIGLLFSTVRENSIQTAIESGGSHHVVISNVALDQRGQLEKNGKIETVLMRQAIGFSKMENPKEEYRPYFYVNGLSDRYLKELRVKEGRLPSTTNEIVLTVGEDGLEDYHIGDQITMHIGDRKIEGETISDNVPYSEKETFEPQLERTYTIVGIVDSLKSESRSGGGYYVYTKVDEDSGQPLNAIITYYSVDDVYEKTRDIALNLGFKEKTEGNFHYFEEVSYNEYLLSMYGQSQYGNVMEGMYGLILMILALISIACIIVIYNSFAISVMERKKQFGLFASIGATKKQIRHTVFFEAFFIGLIGIPLGVLGGYIGIWCVIEIINALLPSAFSVPLELSTYLPLVLIPIGFMIVVILLSAYLPARKAAKVTPIEAIRQNDDIKISGRKVKTPKWIRKIFGIEGEIALKNMKRSKKKYRITIVSLFISIVLFISFSALLDYGIEGSTSYLNDRNYDITLYISDQQSEKIEDYIHSLENEEEVEKVSYFRNYYFEAEPMQKEDYDPELYRIFKDNLNMDDSDIGMVRVYGLEKSAYEEYKKSLGLTSDRPILVDVTNRIYYDEDLNRKTYHGPIYNQKEVTSLSLWKYVAVDETYDMEDPSANYEKDAYVLEDLYYADEVPFGVPEDGTMSSPLVVVSPEMYDDIVSHLSNEDTNNVMSSSYEVSLKAPTYQKLDKKFQKEEEGTKFEFFSYHNIAEDMKMQRNMILVLKILLYGFIGLVTLIGVTSVFNTINTNIMLRRKEFAMLRSMGLTPSGFNRILCFESLFFGLKSLCYGYIASLGIVYLFHTQIMSIVNLGGMMIPWKAMIYAAIGVFLIVLLSMFYASKKIRKENILDAIRDENI